MPPKFRKPAPSTSSTGPRVLYWFRTDLRLHDSPALTHALSLNPSVFIPLWTWDPHYVYTARGAVNRWNFLLECMRDVSASLAELNARQKLWVVRRAPGVIVPALLRKWGIDVLVFEKDTDAYARGRDAEVTKAAEALGVQVVSICGRTLFDPDEIVKANGDRATMSMGQLVKAAAKVGSGKPARPLEAPSTLPDPLSEGDMDLSDLEREEGVGEGLEDFNRVQRTVGDGKKQYETGIMGPKRDFAVPTMEEMGMEEATTPHRGGETAALALLKKYIDDEEYIGTFEKPLTAPTAFEPQSTTLISPHMHFGSLSVRKFWWDVQDVFERRRKAKKHVAGEPVNIPGQLLFRDMYFAAQAKVGFAFGQAVGNPVARFVPWHLQSCVVKGADGSLVNDGTYIIDDPQAEEYFRRWKEGRTGFPWIDALMRQLKQEGWIHHLGRHAVACFLTRGGCYVSWERGAAVFEEWLLDHEVACNAGNWMWLSCTAFFSQFYRCYSPISFPKKWDAEGHFVRRYVPELAKFDKKYIYEPHKAPIADQKAWGCSIKGDGTETGDGKMAVYPKPMFDFNERRQFCIDSIKKAYDVGLYGDDARVLDGTWKKLFDFDDHNGPRKEEANETLGRGIKRSHPADAAYHDDDLGENADEGDQTEKEEAPRKAAKKDKAGAKKGNQKTLDTMVTRSRNRND